MADIMIGKWKLETSDNFEEYMKALDVNMAMRKIGSLAQPTVQISVSDDGLYQLKTVTTFKTTVICFRLGEPFDEETLDGRKVKATMTMNGNTLVHDQKGDRDKGQKDSVIRRAFDGDTITCTCLVDDIVATRVYKREK